MKINVTTIPDEGRELEASYDKDWLIALLPERDRSPFMIDTVSVRCSVSAVGRTVSMSLTIMTDLHLECCRCLKEFILPAHSEFTYTFVPAETMPRTEELELTGDDLGFGYYADDTIDVDPLILEQIVLQIPLKPVCAESCRGLCPHCGIDLNTETCDHGKADGTKSPFAILKNLHIDDSKKTKRG